MDARACPQRLGMQTGRIDKIIQKMAVEARWSVVVSGTWVEGNRGWIHKVWVHENIPKAPGHAYL